jgi:protein-S-isoprenylcysteine O-methyltransferase Ste14
MEFAPHMSFGWLNGWLAILSLGLTQGVLFLAFPKDVVSRLWDRSGWSVKQQAFTIIGKLCAFACLVLLTLSPLKIHQPVFVIGLVVIFLGLTGLVKALFDFKDTPMDEPVRRGLYRISRHPQIVMSSLVLLGACIAVGSWLALVFWAAARLLEHFGIVAEEEVCLQKYGAAYRGYLQQVPRYFIFF